MRSSLQLEANIVACPENRDNMPADGLFVDLIAQLRWKAQQRRLLLVAQGAVLMFSLTA